MLRVIRFQRSRYGCRVCESAVAPTPERPVANGLPTAAPLRHVAVSQFSWHIPLQRQTQMMAASGIARPWCIGSSGQPRGCGRIRKIYEIGARVRGLTAGIRVATRQRETKSLVETLNSWLMERLGEISTASTESIRRSRLVPRTPFGPSVFRAGFMRANILRLLKNQQPVLAHRRELTEPTKFEGDEVGRAYLLWLHHVSVGVWLGIGECCR
jgi:hypothetical protein